LKTQKNGEERCFCKKHLKKKQKNQGGVRQLFLKETISKKKDTNAGERKAEEASGGCGLRGIRMILIPFAVREG